MPDYDIYPSHKFWASASSKIKKTSLDFQANLGWPTPGLEYFCREHLLGQVFHLRELVTRRADAAAAAAAAAVAAAAAAASAAPAAAIDFQAPLALGYFHYYLYENEKQLAYGLPFYRLRL